MRVCVAINDEDLREVPHTVLCDVDEDIVELRIELHVNRDWFRDVRVRVHHATTTTTRAVAGFDLQFPTVLSEELIPNSKYGTDYMQLRVLPHCVLDLGRHTCYFVVERFWPSGHWTIAVSPDRWMQRTFEHHYVPLPFYHPDHDEEEDRVPLAMRQQRRYHWWVHRTETRVIGGSGAVRLLGFFPSRNNNDNSRRDRMSLGRQFEHDALMIYLTHFKQYEYQVRECGMIAHPEEPLLGASPDGLIINPRMSWSDCPPWARRQRCDVTRGVLEIKVSGGLDLEPRGYYMVQIYMEMMAAQTVWAHLVKYAPKENRCRVYRVFRNPDFEKQLLDFLLLKKGDPAQLRATCDQMAAQLKGMQIRVPPLHAYHEWVAHFQKGRPAIAAGKQEEESARVSLQVVEKHVRAMRRLIEAENPQAIVTNRHVEQSIQALIDLLGALRHH